ncbi:MAG: hypothetical protein GY829_14460 [Gammaproteobacteria bacterium]|nr:hypothetical protein [Gammaproteobacteria bacterium]
MKKSIFALLIIITSAISLDVTAADNSNDQLYSMDLIELNASMKADWLLAGKLLILDIEDDLGNQQNFPRISDEFVRMVNTDNQSIFAVNSNLFSNKVAE